MRLLPALVLSLAAMAAVLSLAAMAARGEQLPPSLLDRARAAIADGQLDEADRILGAARAELVDRNDLDFLRGAVAMARGDADAAIAAFRSILVRDPSLNRVRLELGRALFLAGDDEASLHHFRIAQAAGLPSEAQRKVDAFLDQIRRRRRWGVDVALGLAPDSNVNAGTGARVVNLYGLPFSLDDSARKTSGLGLAASVGGSVQAALDGDTRLVMGGRFGMLDYQGGRYDDRSVSAFLGPRFLIGAASEVTTTAIASRRWYGGEGFSTGAGGRVEGQTTLSPRLLLSASATLQHMAYDDVSAFDGPVATTALGLTYGLDEASLVRFDVAVMREQAREEAFRDTQLVLGASYYRELPWGFGISLGGSVNFARYDARLAAFGVTRHDDTVTTRIALSNRTIAVFGFTPVLAYIHTDRMSSIALYEFSRDRVEISVTRNF